MCDDSMETTSISGALRSTIALAIRSLSIAVAVLLVRIAPSCSVSFSAAAIAAFKTDIGAEGDDVRLFR